MSENKFRLTLAVLAALTLLLAVWLLRFDVSPAPSASGPARAFKLDRWTGQVQVVSQRSGANLPTSANAATMAAAKAEE